VSHAGILERTVDVGGKAVRVGGLCGVWTVPEHQGRGIGSAGVEAAAAFIRDELKAEFGMLFCRPRREQFYGRLGWQKVAEPLTLTFDGPVGKMFLPMTTMVLSCTGQKWPEGTIDFRGLPW
jgi:GNAT superfamily N-acetyltransferase